MTFIIEIALPFLFFSPFGSHRVFAAYSQVRDEAFPCGCFGDAGDDVELLMTDENACKVVVVDGNDHDDNDDDKL